MNENKIMLKIDKENCIGCGMCASEAEKVFKIGDDGKAEVITQDFTDYESEVNSAIENCPAKVISK